MTSLCRLDLGPYGPTLQFRSRIKQRQHFDFSHVVFPKKIRRYHFFGWDFFGFMVGTHPCCPCSSCPSAIPSLPPRPDPWPMAPLWIDPAEDRHLDCREGKHQRQSQGVRGGLGHGWNWWVRCATCARAGRCNWQQGVEKGWMPSFFSGTMQKVGSTLLLIACIHNVLLWDCRFETPTSICGGLPGFAASAAPVEPSIWSGWGNLSLVTTFVRCIDPSATNRSRRRSDSPSSMHLSGERWSKDIVSLPNDLRHSCFNLPFFLADVFYSILIKGLDR